MNKITKSFLALLLLVTGVVSAQAQGWYDASKFNAKDYEGFVAQVVTDPETGEPVVYEKTDWSSGWPPKTITTYPNGDTMYKMTEPAIAAARYDADGDYIEVKSNARPVEDYNCQFWMQIPEELRANGTKIEVSMQAWVDEENGDIQVQPQIHNLADPDGDGNSWLDNSNPKVTFVAGKWTDIKYVFTLNKDQVAEYCFNLSDTNTEKARTYRFKNIQFAAAKPDWYYANEFHAKDYHDKAATYSNDASGQTFFPEPPFVYTEDGGYVEVIATPKGTHGNSTYDAQLFIKIPDEYVGKSTKLTMQVQASKAVEGVSQSYHAGASGAGWGASADPDKKTYPVDFTVGEWTDISVILNTKDVTAKGQLAESQQVNYYVLDLSYGDAEEYITYMFKDVKFDKAQEAWYTDGEIIAKDYTKGDETYTNSDTEKFPLAPYVYDDKGDYVKVISNADPEHDYDSQIWIEIPEAWVGKKVKMTMQVQASKEVTAAAAYHSFPGGNHWGPGAGEGVDFTVGEWTPIERILNTKNVLCNKQQQVKYYVLNLSNDAEAITYQFKDIAWSEAPVDNWVDIVPLQDFEAYTGADDEALYVFEKEEPIGSETYRARIVEGKGKDGGNAIEFRTAENAEQGWYSQLSIRFPYALPNGTKVKITADIKATLNTEGLGGQIWNSGFGSYAGGGPSVKFDAVDEWTAYEQETTVNVDKSWDGSDITPKTLRFWVFDGPGGKAANIYYFDNIRVQVPADVLPFKDAEGQEIEADPLLGKDYPIFKWTDPTSLEYTEELITNGDFEDEDMDAFVAKIATEDDADPQILPIEAVDLEKYAVEGKDGDGRNGIAITALKQSENGSADETQLWVRLNEVLPEGTYYVVEFDVMSTNINEIPTWLDINPGTNSSKDGIAKGAAGSVAVKVAAAGEYLHYTNYCVAPEGGVGSIAFNLAGDKNYKYWFDNFSVKIPADAETEEVDEDLWDATLELNVAIDLGKKTETEGYTEESVKALTDAIADGKAELKNAEADAESLAEAAADIILAIEGLEEAAPELAYTDLTQEMFFQWSAADGTGEAINTSNCDLNLNQDIDQIYGLSTVDYDRFADLSEYATIEVTTAATAEFEPRLLFNRIEDNGTVNQEVPRDAAKFETVVDNEDGTKTYIVDLAAIVAEQGYAHLHAIKRQGWSGTTNVTAIKLGYVGEQPSIPVPTAIEGVETADTVKDGKYFIDGQIVIVKGGVKYNAAGVAIQ